MGGEEGVAYFDHTYYTQQEMEDLEVDDNLSKSPRDDRHYR